MKSEHSTRWSRDWAERWGLMNTCWCLCMVLHPSQWEHFSCTCVYRWGPERELMKNMCCAGSSHSLVIAVTLGHMLADMHQDWQLETVDWYPSGTEVSFIHHCNQHVCFNTAVLLHRSYFNNFDENFFCFFFVMNSRRTSGKTDKPIKASPSKSINSFYYWC